LESVDLIRAIELHRLSHIAFWDATLMQAARLSGASILYSEHLAQGDAIIGGIKVVNPFAQKP
jgi:predicted nucleic acid-binding protein